MLFALVFVELAYRHEFLITFSSGLWALIPDLGWLLLKLQLPEAATVWKATFNSVLGYLFWFHPLLDSHEWIGRLGEMLASFVLLILGVTVYYLANDWEADDRHSRK